MIFRLVCIFLFIQLHLFDQSQERFSQKDLTGKGDPKFYSETISLLPEVGKAFKAMQKEALKEGIKIEIVSAYRSYNRQKIIWNSKFQSNAEKGLNPEQNINKIIEYSTIPGTSRHHWGTDVDIIDGNKPKNGDVLLEKKFHGNGPYVELRKWMDTNANQFGFYKPYTKDHNRKGFNYEPWHYSYAPLAIPMLKEYLKLELNLLLLSENLEGKSYISNRFLSRYLEENILGISDSLK